MMADPEGVFLGLNTAIVKTLRQYGNVPEDYLARLLRRDRDQIHLAVERLLQDGVVERDERQSIRLSGELSISKTSW